MKFINSIFFIGTWRDLTVIIQKSNIQNLKGLNGKKHLKEKETEDVFTGKDEFALSSFGEEPDFISLRNKVSSWKDKNSGEQTQYNILSGTSMSEPLILPEGVTGTHREQIKCKDGGFAEVVVFERGK